MKTKVWQFKQEFIWERVLPPLAMGHSELNDFVDKSTFIIPTSKEQVLFNADLAYEQPWPMDSIYLHWLRVANVI